jgi:hypothetical protein
MYVLRVLGLLFHQSGTVRQMQEEFLSRQVDDISKV